LTFARRDNKLFPAEKNLNQNRGQPRVFRKDCGFLLMNRGILKETAVRRTENVANRGV